MLKLLAFVNTAKLSSPMLKMPSTGLNGSKYVRTPATPRKNTRILLQIEQPKVRNPNTPPVVAVAVQTLSFPLALP